MPMESAHMEALVDGSVCDLAATRAKSHREQDSVIKAFVLQLAREVCLLTLTCIFTVGCASLPRKMYVGPSRVPEQIAVIQLAPNPPFKFYQPVCHYELVAVDGVKLIGKWEYWFSLRQFPKAVNVLPGSHQVDVHYVQKNCESGPVSTILTYGGNIPVDAAANHTYTISWSNQLWSVSASNGVSARWYAK